MSNQSEKSARNKEQVIENNQEKGRQRKNRSGSTMPDSIINSVGPDLSIPMDHGEKIMTGYDHHQHQKAYEHDQSMMPVDYSNVQGMGDHSSQHNYQPMYGHAYCQHCGYQPTVMPQCCYPNHYYQQHPYGYRY